MTSGIVKPGMVFGKLTVIGYAPSTKKPHRSQILVRCECGTEKIVGQHHLTSGNTKTCGCSKLSPHYDGDPLFSIKNKLFSNYKCRAKRLNKSFDLSYSDFTSLILQPCFYCGALPSNGNNSFNYNGIDRVDNSKGYISGNCVPCCIQCNRSKSSMTQEEYREWITQVYNNYCTENNTK